MIPTTECAQRSRVWLTIADAEGSRGAPGSHPTLASGVGPSLGATITLQGHARMTTSATTIVRRIRGHMATVRSKFVSMRVLD